MNGREDAHTCWGLFDGEGRVEGLGKDRRRAGQGDGGRGTPNCRTRAARWVNR
jgi:hypothetical protein